MRSHSGWPLARRPCSRSASRPAAAATTSSTSSSRSAPARRAQVSGTINGAGSTFPAPVYQQWGSHAQGPGHHGQLPGRRLRRRHRRSSQQGTVDFGASDPRPERRGDRRRLKKGEPGPDPDRASARSRSPTTSRASRPGLKLDGATIADIFLGKIKKWNDPAIAKLNSGAQLPDTNITVVHRSDSSGTTKGFTQFLADYSPEWKSGPGVDKTVKWPTGTGAKGNDGVAAAVKQTDGAIGYVEQAYALQNNFTFAAVKNKAGNFVAPTLESTSAAGDGLERARPTCASPRSTRRTRQAYPIVSQTFVIVYKDLVQGGHDRGRRRRPVKAFIDYGLSDDGPGRGQGAALRSAAR